MRITEGEQILLNIFDKYGNIIPRMILISAYTGGGKGLSQEGLAQIYHEDGKCVVIFICDPKQQIEAGYAQFLPKSQYHLEALRKEGRIPRKKQVKIYHPFTFNIPKGNLPDYNIYTMSLKSLTRADFSMLLETQSDNDSIKLLLSAIQKLEPNEGLHSLLHLIGDMTIGKKEGKTIKYDKTNFYLPVTSGTAKSLQDISNNFKIFEKHYFLAKDSCKYNIDMEQIINDRENYHVFTTRYINDPKLSEFNVLYVLNKILECESKAKYPILIVIPEVKYLCPFKAEGYKKFLALELSNALSMMRSKGRGFCCIMDTQNITGVNEEVRNAVNYTLLGEIGGASELDKVCKMLSLNQNIKKDLKKMPYRNSYYIYQEPEKDPFRIFFPTHCHCEPSYKFEEMFEKEYPERMKNFKDVMFEMKKDLKTDEDKIKEKIKKRQKEEQEMIEKRIKEKEERSEKKLKVEEKVEKAKEIESKSKNELKRLIYEAKQKEPKKSWRKLAEEFGVHHLTAKKNFYDYEKIIKEKESVDYEDKVMEELNE